MNSITYPDGTMYTYQFDSMDRPWKMTQVDAAGTVWVKDVLYNVAGRMTEMWERQVEGAVSGQPFARTVWQYNVRQQLTRITTTPVFSQPGAQDIEYVYSATMTGSGTGCRLTPDPYVASAGVSEPGSWNRYAYVEGDPVNFNDPAGLVKCETVSATTGIGIAQVHCTTALGQFVPREVPFDGNPLSDDWFKVARDAERTWGAELDREEAREAIAPIADLARRAFGNPDCARLFSGQDVISPDSALDLLWSRIDVSFGDITTLFGEPRDSETSPEGFRRPGLRSGFPFIGAYYLKANIKLGVSWWLTSDERERLSGFIHELGHAIGYLSVGDITGGFVHEDRGLGINSIKNTNLIRDNCVNPLLAR